MWYTVSNAIISTDRRVIAFIIASLLSFHGLRKRSLSKSGAVAAFFVGFVSFAASIRFGIILVLFYLTGSQLTKLGAVKKAKLEESYVQGGQRSWIQVFACSILATVCAIAYMYMVGEDQYIDFGATSGWAGKSGGNVTLLGITMTRRQLGSYLWALYLSHYACATADTWASEVGVLSYEQPVLITSLLLFRVKKVPHGTNGGVSKAGTIASIAGGLVIGLAFFLSSFALGITTIYNATRQPDQGGMILLGGLAGFLGSTIDSLLGATLQATYYSQDRKCIVKRRNGDKPDSSTVLVCGYDVLSNEGVNLVSTLLTMVISTAAAPYLFCLFDSLQCPGGWGARAAARTLNLVPRQSPLFAQ